MANIPHFEVRRINILYIEHNIENIYNLIESIQFSIQLNQMLTVKIQGHTIVLQGSIALLPIKLGILFQRVTIHVSVFRENIFIVYRVNQQSMMS